MKTSLLLLETGNGLEHSQGVSEPAAECATAVQLVRGCHAGAVLTLNGSRGQVGW